VKRALIPVLLALALPATAAANPPSPSMRFAYDVATAHMGSPANCTSMDLQTIPNGEQGFAALASPAPLEPQPCYIYMARWIAAPRSFGNACRTFYNILADMQGIDASYAAMPFACRVRVLFLMNHPYYLERHYAPVD
jgi:hypothetical protein